MGRYLGPIDIKGTVAPENIEEIFRAPNDGSSLGTIIVKNLVIIDPAPIARGNKYPANEAEGRFEVRSIHRDTSEQNNVAGASDEGYPQRFKQERISALGAFSGLSIGAFVIQEGDHYIDYEQAGLSIVKNVLHTDPSPYQATIQLTAWEGLPE